MKFISLNDQMKKTRGPANTAITVCCLYMSGCFNLKYHSTTVAMTFMLGITTHLIHSLWCALSALLKAYRHQDNQAPHQPERRGQGL